MDRFETFPAVYSEAMTAVCLPCRIRLREEPRSKPVHAAAAATIVECGAQWHTATGTIDFYYWFAATHTMSRLGGEHFAAWRRQILPVLGSSQLAGGSWPPAGAWCAEGGKCFATAPAVMSVMPAFRRSRLLIR